MSLSHVDCAAGLGSGLRAYTAFHTQAPIVPGNVVLITGAASVSETMKFISVQKYFSFLQADGVVMIQWCEYLGAKVWAFCQLTALCHKSLLYPKNWVCAKQKYWLLMSETNHH